MTDLYSGWLKDDPLTVRLLTRCALAGTSALAVLSFNAAKPTHAVVWTVLSGLALAASVWTERRWFSHLRGGLIP